MSMDSQRLKIFKIAQECNGSPTRISHALIDAGFRDVGELREWLEETKKAIDKVYEVDTYNMGYADAINAILSKLEKL
jgi:hypothetical protein